MRLLARKDRRGRWTVATVAPDSAEVAAPAQTSPVPSKAATRPAPEPSVWELELERTRSALERADVARLEAFCERCLSEPARLHAMDVPAGEAWRSAVMRALARRGARVRGLATERWTLRAHCVCGAAAGLGVLADTLLRAMRERSAPLPPSRVLAAIHGERSNRTRHVIAALRAASSNAPVLVLGRPRLPLGRVRAMLREEGLAHNPVTRPYDPRTLVRAIGRWPLHAADGTRAVLAHTSRPTVAELARLFYRVLLGDASAEWWRRGGARAECVIYGHTGLADTTMLELAQQRDGARTVHWVHGLTAGRQWIGRSTVGLFKCAHDARWHERLGGYGVATAVVASRPACRTGGEGWLLLTNLVHPMNPTYRAHGPDTELRLLSLVADAARAVGVDPAAVTWKPHPTFRGEPEEVQRLVLSRVAALGFTRWDDARELSAAAEYAIVLSTASTAALDVLRLGKLPIIVQLEADEPGAGVLELPIIVRSADELATAVRRLGSPAEAECLFAKAWTALGPGDRLDLDAVVALAGERDTRAPAQVPAAPAPARRAPTTTRPTSQSVRTLHIVPNDGVGGVEVAARSGAAAGSGDYIALFLAGAASGDPHPAVRYGEARSALGLGAARFALRTARRDRPAVIVVSLWRSVVAFLLLRVAARRSKLALLLHAERPVHLADRAAHALMLRLADAVWSDSALTLDARYPRAARRKPTRVVSFLARRIVGRRRELPEPKFVFWGRLTEQKNVRRAIELFAGIARDHACASFTVIGRDDGLRASLEQQARSAGLERQVAFLGERSFEEIREIAAACSFYLQTSTFEGMAMSVVEAMQLGLVPVVTPVGEIANYCRHWENAILVNDIVEARRDVLAALSDPARFAKLSEAAIRTWRDAPLYADDITAAARELAADGRRSR